MMFEKRAANQASTVAVLYRVFECNGVTVMLNDRENGG